MRQFLRPVCVALILAGSTLSLSCSGGNKVVLAPVSGTVTLDGQPVTSGQVAFLPASKDTAPKAGLAAANISAEGKYTLITDGKDGAPIGSYKVTVTPSMVPVDGKMPTAGFNQKYQSIATTPLQFEVIATPEPGRYDLKLTK